MTFIAMIWILDKMMLDDEIMWQRIYKVTYLIFRRWHYNFTQVHNCVEDSFLTDQIYLMTILNLKLKLFVLHTDIRLLSSSPLCEESTGMDCTSSFLAQTLLPNGTLV